MGKISVFLLALVGFVNTSSAYSQKADYYKIERINEILDGSFGVKKLYFDLDCNQKFLQLLQRDSAPDVVEVAVLTIVTDRDCDRPATSSFVRFSAGTATIEPVSSFNEVWDCKGFCYTPGGPDMPPYMRAVQAFGTSQDQAISYLGCTPPYLQDLSCLEIAPQSSVRATPIN